MDSSIQDDSLGSWTRGLSGDGYLPGFLWLCVCVCHRGEQRHLDTSGGSTPPPSSPFPFLPATLDQNRIEDSHLSSCESGDWFFIDLFTHLSK